jgi:hypothetical protein
MKTPKILPWIARRAGLSEPRVEELWREALYYATEQTGWVGTSEYWEAAERRLLQLVEREKKTGCLPAPELSGLVRLQARIAHLPLLVAECWSVAWARRLASRGRALIA